MTGNVNNRTSGGDLPALLLPNNINRRCYSIVGDSSRFLNVHSLVGGITSGRWVRRFTKQQVSTQLKQNNFLYFVQFNVIVLESNFSFLETFRSRGV